MIVFWAAAAAVFLVIELLTYSITSIWFALGALCSLLATALGAPLWLQILWFVIISVLTLLLTRPLVRKYINGKAQPTNADRVIGMEGVVSEAIDNLNGAGAVRVDGKVWSARSAGGGDIPAGAAVRVLSIHGVKLIVEPAEPPKGPEPPEEPEPEPEDAPADAPADGVEPSIAEAAAAAAAALAPRPEPAAPPEEESTETD